MFNSCCLPTETEFDVKTKYIVADFSKGQSIYQSIENELAGIPIGILGMFNQKQWSMVINNVNDVLEF